MTLQAATISDFERAQRRLRAMAETDPQIARAVPLEAVTRSVRTVGIAYREIIANTLAGYAERPALGTRTFELRPDSDGHHVRHYLPSFTTITFRELARRIEAIASVWQHHPRHRVGPGDFVAFIAFASAEMVAVDLACAYAQAIAVPLQANLTASDMNRIFADTHPVALVATIENLELAAGYAQRHHSVHSLVVIDAEVGDEAERKRIGDVRRQLRDDGDRIALASFAEIIELGARGAWTPPPRRIEGQNALMMLMYTSGSTGTPKGAMIHETMCNQLWSGISSYQPSIQVVCAPLNHFLGRHQVYPVLAQGGTAYFTLKSDMSTLFEDIRIVRPTAMFFFPRIAEIIYQHYRSEVQRRVVAGGDPEAVDAAVRLEMHDSFLGDRLVSAGVAGSPTAPEVKAFLRECFDIAFFEGYASTEAGTGAILRNGRVQHDIIVDYKLLDAPELGYYATDRPHPRGELLVKSRLSIKGYYKRPDATAAVFDDEGWLHTGDIMEQRGPDQFAWIGRRNNVIKLSQGEFVAFGALEAAYLGSALISQIFLYGSSYRSFLLAVVVPDAEIARARLGPHASKQQLRALILAELQERARFAGLKSFEVPRDVLIELEPFTHENGLLSSVRKPLRPKLTERYQDALEAIYREIERKGQEELALLREAGGLLTLDRVAGALKANLGLESIDPASPQSYYDLGGDSLGAVSLSLLLEDLFGVTVPVSILLDPAGTPGRLAQFIDNELAGGDRAGGAASFASVHGDNAQVLRAADLELGRFFDPTTLAAAARASAPAVDTRTILLTGATGFLGRFLCLKWMEQFEHTAGKVICLVRAADVPRARARLDAAIGAADPDLTDRFRMLAVNRLEVISGDLAKPRLGLDEATFQRLADEVDQIVHPGALVNHLLSYQNLFEPNVVGTAELLRLALSGRQKRFEYVSTFGVPQIHHGLISAPEEADVRERAPEIPLGDGYAAGYCASKWASEVLLREASEHFSLPITIYRPDMIMAHSQFKGQLNVPDMFTRLLFSVVVTGIAPASFYEPEADGSRARTHYDGMPVDFLAATIQQLGASPWRGFRTFNTISGHLDDGISLDTITDWVASAGYAIQRIGDHADWLRRFADRLRQLPDDQRQHSALAILGYVAQPHAAHRATVRNDTFVAAVRVLAAGPEVPQINEAFIHKYLDDMRLVGLLTELEDQ